VDDVALARLTALLSAEERKRAGRLRSEKAARQYAASLGVLREVLGRCAGVEPASLAFRRNAHGKPSLEGAGEGLGFNLSHSGDWMLVAVARGRQVGVDIERVNARRPLRRLAERFFAPGEREALRAVPDAGLAEAFYTCWTRKEAYLKARGEGLHFPLGAFEVSVSPEAPALLRVEGEPEEAGRWSVRDVPVPEGYAGAVVVEGREWRLECGDWG